VEAIESHLRDLNPELERFRLVSLMARRITGTAFGVNIGSAVIMVWS
jgi:hypothetical protein